MMGGYGPVLSSPPLELHWKGWVAKSDDLAYAGWKFEVIKNMSSDYLDVIAVAFQSPDREVRGITDYFSSRDAMEAKLSRMPIRCEVKMGRDVQINQYNSRGNDFSSVSVDMSYEYDMFTNEKMSCHRISDLFRETESGLLIPEDTVPDLLDKILKLQEPAKQDRFKERVREHKAKTIQAKVFSLG